jgi:spermidine synthase
MRGGAAGVGETRRFWRGLFAACYAASGAAALIYQVVWTRLFTLELGHTVAGSSTVLAAFMGGLASGAWLAGRSLPSPSRRLPAYARLEVLVAVFAIALPFALLVFRPALAWAYADGGDPIRFALIRVAAALLLIGFPAAAMGATFPIAAAWLTDALAQSTPHRRVPPAADVGFAYAANTAGAAVGAVAAGFWLVPAVGLQSTTFVAVALNVAAAGGALWLARLRPVVEAPAANSRPKDGAVRSRRASTSAPPALRAWPALASVAAALSGFAALVYEVAWTRLLALAIGPTTYAFATMAAAFISGIALGAAGGTRIAGRTRQPAVWLAAMLLLMAVASSSAAWFVASRLPLMLASELAGSVGGNAIFWREAFAVLLLLMPTGIASGAAFTLALATASSGAARIGSETARVYAFNTLGSVAGALTAGFVLVPRLGLEATIVGMSRVTAGAAIVIAAVALARGQAARFSIRTVTVGAALGVTVVGVAGIPEWDRGLLASGAYKYAGRMGSEELEARLRAGTLEYYKEGAAGTVSVRRSAGTRALAIDGKIDASNGADMLTQRLLGLLPILMHPSPDDMLVIGLGSGVTAGSALGSGQVRRADVVEISPEVVAASALFAAENGGVLSAPGLRLLTGDGRSHLLLTHRQYDVIVSEPSNPWMAGVAALFTREFFTAARARLKPDGLFCQWAHTYEMDEGDLKSIVATFASVFPEGTMWLVGEGDLLLIGGHAAIEAHLPGIVERVRREGIAAPLAELGMTGSAAPFVLLSQFVGGPAHIAAYGRGAPLQTDDRMALEFTAARAIYASSSADNTRAIRDLTAGFPVPAVVASTLRRGNARDWRALGTTALKANASLIAYESFQRAVALDSRDAISLHGASSAAALARRLPNLRSWLTALAAREPDNAEVRIELARVLAAGGDAEGAIAAAVEAGKLAPESPLPMEQLASIFEDLGDGGRLGQLAQELSARFPQREQSEYYQAAALFLSGRPVAAEEGARRVLAKNPRYAKAQSLLGVACAAARRLDCARRAFEASLRLTPGEPSPYLNLGIYYLDAADPATAASYFAEALALDAASPMAREGLARARAAR